MRTLTLALSVALILPSCAIAADQEKAKPVDSQEERPEVVETPQVVQEIADALQAAQKEYFAGDWEKNGVHEYAKSLQQLKARKLIPDEVAAAEAELPNRAAYKGYFISVKTKSLFMNQTENHHGWWKGPDWRVLGDFMVKGHLTGGVGIVLEHEDKKIDSATHCLCIGELAESSTSSNLLSLNLKINPIDFVPFWVTWIPRQ